MQGFSCEFFKMFKNTFFPDHLWMTASALKQLLALYFPIIYSWQLSSSEKSLVGKNVHPYISKILQISFIQIFFFSFTMTNACVILVGYAKRMLYSEQPTVLFARKYLNTTLLTLLTLLTKFFFFFELNILFIVSLKIQ